MFIAIPVGMNYRTERFPWVTLSLIGLNTLVWLVSTVCLFCTHGKSEVWILHHLWLVPSAITWTACFTSMFVHAGIFHLLGNMLFLFLFGACVEDMIGRLRFLVFYLIGGLVAEFVYIAMLPEHFHSAIPMGGASGAISACMGMYLLLRAGAHIEFKYFLWLFFIYLRAGEFEVPAWVAIAFWFLTDLVFAVIGMFSDSARGGVAFGAHVGGFLGGLALVAIYKWFGRSRDETDEPGEVSTLPARSYQLATGDTSRIYLHDGTRQMGPFTLFQIEAMLRRGTISHDMLYWSEGMTEWQRVAALAVQPAE